MIRIPSLKKYFRVEAVPSEGVFLLSEFGHFVLTGHLQESLVPLIDGTRTADALVEALADRARPEEVYYALLMLEQKGFIEESDVPGARPHTTTLWNYLGGDARSIQDNFEATQVDTIVTPDLDGQPIIIKVHQSRSTPAGQTLDAGETGWGYGVHWTYLYPRADRMLGLPRPTSTW
jgi:hypothetical protein